MTFKFRYKPVEMYRYKYHSDVKAWIKARRKKTTHCPIYKKNIVFTNHIWVDHWAMATVVCQSYASRMRPSHGRYGQTPWNSHLYSETLVNQRIWRRLHPFEFVMLPRRLPRNTFTSWSSMSHLSPLYWLWWNINVVVVNHENSTSKQNLDIYNKVK